MALKKITAEDLSGKGVLGQPNVPGLSAEEMQRKVEEIVRDVVIPAMNENADEAENLFATKNDLEQVVLDSGAVGTVFGRVGNVVPQKGDYTAEMVGAAKDTHAENHLPGGTDPIDVSVFGLAEKAHSHGDITNDGKIGTAAGLLVVTGAGGKLSTENKAAAGFVLSPANITASGSVSVTVENNTEYVFTEVSSLSLGGNALEAHGFVTFGAAAPAISVTGFIKSGGDDVAQAKASEIWEFSCYNGYILWKNWSA